MPRKSKIPNLPINIGSANAVLTAQNINGNMTMLWDNNAFKKEKCLLASIQLKAKPEHHIILLKEFFSSIRRDPKGNLIKPTVSTKLRNQGFQVKVIYTNMNNEHKYGVIIPYDSFRVIHIRNQEKLNYFRLLFENEIDYCVQVQELKNEQ